MKLRHAMFLTATLLVVLLIAAGPLATHDHAAAQGTDGCPAVVLLGLARAGSTCGQMDHNEACYGNGTVTAAMQPAAGDALAQPGDRVPITDLQQIATVSGEEWPVAIMEMQADIPATEQRFVTLLLFGEAAVTNEVPPLPTLTISATGHLTVRATPEADGDIIDQLDLRQTLTANGRTAGGDWLRVLVPGQTELGWVSVDVLTTEGNIAQLDVVDADTPFFRPFQRLTVQTGRGDAWCSGVPQSGVLLQTPSTTDVVHFTLNGAEIAAAATVFIQGGGDGALTLRVLDGEVVIGVREQSAYIPAGAQVALSTGADARVTTLSDVVPYSATDLLGLPINNLPYRFVVPDPLTPDVLAELTATVNAPPPTPTLTAEQRDPDRCRYRVRFDTDLRAGPGSFYEVVNGIQHGMPVYPVVQVTDADRLVWWQLTTSNWIRADAVESSGTCEDIPISDRFEAPTTNFLSLETCMTANGPLRAGQRVTVEFIPPGWDNSQDAFYAPRISPGSVAVDSRRLDVRASQPIQTSQPPNENYIRRFSALWQAEPGTHRIVGQRLSYIIICDVTVPLP